MQATRRGCVHNCVRRRSSAGRCFGDYAFLSRSHCRTLRCAVSLLRSVVIAACPRLRPLRGSAAVAPVTAVVRHDDGRYSGIAQPRPGTRLGVPRLVGCAPRKVIPTTHRSVAGSGSLVGANRQQCDRRGPSGTVVALATMRSTTALVTCGENLSSAAPEITGMARWFGNRARTITEYVSESRGRAEGDPQG